MRQKRYLPLFLFILALATIACTCGGFDLPLGGDDGAEATAVVEVEEPAPTDEPAPTAEPAPTEEPEPTATAEPTATPEPEPTPTEEAAAPAGDGVALENEALGVSLVHPAEWVVAEEDLFGIQLASSEEILDQDVFSEGAGVIIFSDPTISAVEPVAALGLFAEGFAGDEEVTLEALSDPESIEINGQEAAEIRYQVTGPEGDQILAIVTAIRIDENAAIVFGAVGQNDVDELLPLVESIIGSVVLSAPAGETVDEPSDGPVDVPDAVYNLEYGTVFTGELAEGGTAAFAFEATADEPLAIMTSASAEFDQVLAVFDADNREVASVDDGFSGEGEVIIFTPTGAGPYVAELSGFAGDGGSFGIVLLPYAEEGPGILLADSDTVSDQAGIDYTITVGVGEAIILLLQPLSEDFDATMTLYDLNDNIIADVDDGFSGEPEAYLFFPEESGDYRLNIAGFAGDTGEYELLIGGAPIAELE